MGVRFGVLWQRSKNHTIRTVVLCEPSERNVPDPRISISYEDNM